MSKEVFTVKGDDNTGAGVTGGSNFSIEDYETFKIAMERKGYRIKRSIRFEGGRCECWERKPRHAERP